MLQIIIINDKTGTNESSNYKYSVLVNRYVIALGNIRGHNRNHGWIQLLKELIKDAEEKQE